MKNTKDVRPYHIRRKNKLSYRRIGLAFIAKKIMHYIVVSLFISMVYVLLSGEEEPKQPNQSVSTNTTKDSNVDANISSSFLTAKMDEIYPDKEIKVSKNYVENDDTNEIQRVEYSNPNNDTFDDLNTENIKCLNEKIDLEDANLPIVSPADIVDDLDVDVEITDLSIIPIEDEIKEEKKNDKIEKKEETKKEQVEDVTINANASGVMTVVGDKRKSYMDYKKITAKSSPQYKLQQIALTDSNGLRMINGRYCVAVATTYGEIGKCIDVILINGNIIPCIIGDHKSPKHTIANNTLGADGGAVEFIVEQSALPVNVRQSGDISSLSSFSGQVTNITMYDANVLNTL